MLETTKIKNNYGQDFEFMSQYFDVIIPTIYKKHYKKNTNWIKETTNYYVKKWKYSKIWTGLQTYINNNNNPQKLSLNEITKDSLAAINGNNDGVILFQFGLTNIINFKDYSFTKKSGSFYNKYYVNDEKEVEEELPEMYVENGIDKPVIYLYPEKEMDISIKLNFKKTYFTTIYPKFNGGENIWNVHAKPNGDIIILNKTYPYLFWEAESYVKQDMNKGLIVKSEDAEKFLEEKLKILGLNDKESTYFITYWLPLLIKNKLSLCSFQTQEFFNNMEMIISPKPHSILRIFLSIKKIDYPINIQEQKLESFERKGFTVVEWGGSKIKN